MLIEVSAHHFSHGASMNEQRLDRQQCLMFGGGALGVALVLALCSPSLAAQNEDQDFKPSRVLAPQPPITKFPVKSVAEAAKVLNPSELVIGVTVSKESRAYPVNMLTGPQREILNDTLDGKAIAATW
jgi:hypothetical protein